MRFAEGLLKARSHIVFLLGLIAAFGTVIVLEQTDFQATLERRPLPGVEETATLSITKPAPLSGTEKGWARIAWTYFENNRQPETGLVNSVDGYPASTMWDTASYLMALISAHRLGLISRDRFDTDTATLLATLKRLPLFENKLPNKSYNTLTGAMVNYQNQPTPEGIGWSAIDIGRLLTPMTYLVWNHPEHTPAIREVLATWDFGAILQQGRLYGAARDETNQTLLLQEGRIGYEEYAAKSFTLMGLDVSQALDYRDYLAFVTVYGVEVPYDSRSPEIYHAHNYVVSEPYILDALEYGWDETSREFAFRVYKAQQARFEATGTLTAVSEDNIDVAPWFVYNTVFTDGKIWNCITEEGEDASDFKSLSTKAAFGWDSIYNTAYTQRLVQAIQGLHDPQKGWYSGRYEKTGAPNTAITCNTNAIILESLCHRAFGKLLNMDDFTQTSVPMEPSANRTPPSPEGSPLPGHTVPGKPLKTATQTLHGENG
ncbi:DUF3131 domain-containing protein [Desulfoluna sp.]|uniref:DUF3131 domain-containing protein n=1 Tax=Desulfoluna sp. TaxID=2045199 RepID=UPI00261D11FD|nr:DUF3131 domain-containing protein [Desulfoluna sp.]